MSVINHHVDSSQLPPSITLLAQSNLPPTEDEIILLKQSLLVSQNQTYTRILSPVRLLPVEIISEILGHAVDDEDIVPNSTQAIWKYGQICSLWRHALVSMSFLWSRVRISGRRNWSVKGPSGKSFHAEAMQVIMERGKPSLLTVNFTDVDGTRPIFLLLFDILVANSNRWKDVTLYLGVRYSSLLQPITGRLDALKSLSLSVHRNGRWRLGQDVQDFDASIFGNAFEHAPELENVTLICRTIPRIASMPFPWSQIVSCRLSNIFESAADETAILSRMQRIREYSIQQGLEHTITLPFLVRLEISSLGFDYSGLAKLVVPALKHLLVRVIAPLATIRAVRTLISHSGCSLHALNWCLEETSLAEFFDLLEAIPSVTNLDIWFTREARTFSEDVVNRLVIVPSRTTLLPRLETLQLRGMYCIGDGPLSQLLESRREAGLGIRSFRGTSTDPDQAEKPSAQLVQLITSLERYGLQVEMEYTAPLSGLEF